MTHKPVLLDEVLAHAAIGSGDCVVDATFGGGGYTRAFLQHEAKTVIGIDRDPHAALRARDFTVRHANFLFWQGPFADIETGLGELGIENGVDVVVFDFGVSSFQLDEAERGFSFMRNGPLDMRMSQKGPSAADAVNGLSEGALRHLFYEYGEEKQAGRVAKAIVRRRLEKPFTTTLDLAQCVETNLAKRPHSKLHPATRIFQALRIFVNDELSQIAEGLKAAERLLRPGGRLIAVTFHSLEDRIVKNFLTNRAVEKSGSRHLPMQETRALSFELPFKKPVTAAKEELENNPRSRSAKLRVGIRTDAPHFEEEEVNHWQIKPDELLHLKSLEGGMRS